MSPEEDPPPRRRRPRRIRIEPKEKPMTRTAASARNHPVRVALAAAATTGGRYRRGDVDRLVDEVSAGMTEAQAVEWRATFETASRAIATARSQGENASARKLAAETATKLIGLLPSEYDDDDTEDPGDDGGDFDPEKVADAARRSYR